MKTETTLNFTPAQLAELKRLVDQIGWATRDDDNKISTYVSDDRIQFARNLASVLNKMETAAIVGVSDTSM